MSHQLVLTRNHRGAAPWHPLRDLERIQREVEGLFGQEAAPAETRSSPDLGTLEPNVYETPEAFVYVLVLPGVAPEALTIETTPEKLTLKGERKPLYENENAKLLRQGAFAPQTGTFEAHYTLPKEINTQGVTAHFRHGVLELSLPKREEVKPQIVKVTVTE